MSDLPRIQVQDLYDAEQWEYTYQAARSFDEFVVGSDDPRPLWWLVSVANQFEAQGCTAEIRAGHDRFVAFYAERSHGVLGVPGIGSLSGFKEMGFPVIPDEDLPPPAWEIRCLRPICVRLTVDFPKVRTSRAGGTP